MRTILLAALLVLTWSAGAWAGTVNITGPSGTAVYLDGVYMGVLPLVLEDLAPGTHQLRLVSPSGEQRSRAVQVPSMLESYQEIDAYGLRVDLDTLWSPPHWSAPYHLPQPFRYDRSYQPPLGYPPFRMHRRQHTPRPPAAPVNPAHRPPGGRGRHDGHR